MDFVKLLKQCRGFQWDKGNQDKNKEKHNVVNSEAEQVFFNQPLFVFDDEVHSKNEKRYGALGQANNGRLLAIFFTIRNNKIRIISARNMSSKDKKVYDQQQKTTKL